MREEQPMDYAVEMSKTLYVARLRLSAAMDDLKAEIMAALFPWRKR